VSVHITVAWRKFTCATYDKCWNWDCCNAGCGFLDTVTKLIKLGADVNARDLTQCTPLQNAAHGTYSALATMPANGSQGGASGVLLHLALPALSHTHDRYSHSVQSSVFQEAPFSVLLETPGREVVPPFVAHLFLFQSLSCCLCAGWYTLSLCKF